MNIFERLGRKLGIRMASKVAAEVGSVFIAKEFDNMTKTSDKIHVLADETLGGILREYVEVEREAEVGDLVYYACDDRLAKVVSDNVADGGGLKDGGETYLSTALGLEASVLEPTDVVRLRDDNDIEQRFRLVDRKAEVGDKVIVKAGAYADEHNLGKVYEVIGIDSDTLIETSGFYADGSALNLFRTEYCVLVPVESESSPQSTDDIIANLVRRVAELERENKAMLDVYERGQKWTHERINGVKDDIETWAQEHVKTKKELDDKIEMCIDDIVALDERTQPTKITLAVDDLARLIGGDR